METGVYAFTLHDLILHISHLVKPIRHLTVMDRGSLRLQYCMTMRFLLLFLLLLAACGPVEPPAEDSGAGSSVESVGQWSRDPNDNRTVVDRPTLDEINNTLLSTQGTGALLAEYTFGDDPATESFTYIDLIRGFSVDLPYNENWSTGTYVLPPYHDYPERSDIEFGPLLFHAQNGYERAFIMRYEPARTIEAAEIAYKAMYPQNDAVITRQTIGSGSAVIVSGIQGVCPAPVIEVAGSTYNVIFTASCEATSRWPDIVELVRENAMGLHWLEEKAGE
jgi:hypothetical protein